MMTRNLFMALAATVVLALALVAPSVAVHADEGTTATAIRAELNAEALMALTRAGTPMTLLDARGTSPEWIAGAKPCPPGATAADIGRLCPVKQGLVVTYCGGADCDASQKLANRLAELGYANVIRFTGGVKGWTEAGFTLKHAEAPAAPAPTPPTPRGSGSR